MNNAQISWMQKREKKHTKIGKNFFFLFFSSFEKRRQFLLHFSANDLLCAQVVNARFLFHHAISLSFFIFAPTSTIPP